MGHRGFGGYTHRLAGVSGGVWLDQMALLRIKRTHDDTWKTMQSDDKLRLSSHSTELIGPQDAELPELIRDAGGAARFAFEEFIHGQIRNPFTRKAYLHAVRRFSEWCAGRQLDLVRITTADVGRYLDSMTVSTPTRKLHLAALRRFFDELVMRHVVILNPALSVRTEQHQAVEGKTPEISIEHARRLLKSIDVSEAVAHRNFNGFSFRSNH